jgi:hypothetical protein
MSKSASLLGREIPLVEAAHYGGRQRPSAVLLRTSWTTGRAGAANGIAQTWHNPRNKVDSCHYVIDTARVIRCVPDKIEAYPMPHRYKGAISINLCYDPPFTDDMRIVMRAAELTARLCKLYNIPVRVLSTEDEANWRKRRWRSRGGILDYTVGDFPIHNFFTFVGHEYKGF